MKKTICLKQKDKTKIGGKIMAQFSKAVMSATAKTIRNSIKDGKGYPSSVTMKDMNGKSHKITKAQYMGLFEAQNVFILKNNRYPNYTTLNSTANNPLVLNYQDDKYSCCVASFNMCVQMLFDWISESKIKSTFKTNTSGTDPSNMISGASKLGYTATKIARNYSAVKKSLQKGYPVLVHYETGGSTKPACMGFSNNYGHYMMIYAVTSDGYYRCADPTKGLKKCNPKAIDGATNGRSIYYYSIKPK